MRILLPTDPPLPVPPVYYGGVERIVAALAVGLRRHGHQVGLIAHPDSTAAVDYFLGWPEVCSQSAGSHWRNTVALYKAVNAFGPSLIHSYSRLLYLAPQLPRKLPKIMSYGRPTGGYRTRAAAFLGGHSLVFTGCSEFIAAMGRAHGGVWHAIPNFVDTDVFRFSPAVPDDAPLVFLSRIEPIKGPHIAIEVAKRTGRRLLIAGNHEEHGVAGDYWHNVIKPQLGQHGVDYLGPVDDTAKIDLLGSAAAMIVPIQWDEPFGVVFAESLACGTPVISCPRGALPEIIRDGVEGFLVRDADQACRAVRDIDRIDRRACRSRSEGHFSAAVVVPQYEALYRTLVEAA